MTPYFTLSSKWLVVVLAVQVGGASAQAQALPTELRAVTVEGEGATGSVRERPQKLAAICVLDQNEKPVSGAAVVFTVPTEGATGVFPNGAKTLMTMTDAQGRASAQGFRFNDIAGKVQLSINISYKGLTARTYITQTSVAPPGYRPRAEGGHKGVLIGILAAAAAGAAGGAYFATHKAGAPSGAPPSIATGPQPIGLTPGNGTLSPPH
jgi:hypothetical protein